MPSSSASPSRHSKGRPAAPVRRLAYLVAALGASLASRTAFAHMPIEGFEGFYVGLLHPLSTPSQLLALLALGVLLGQRWPRAFERAWAAFAGLVLLGMALGQMAFVPEWTVAALLAVAMLAAGLAALAVASSLWPPVFLAGAGGLLIGLVSTPDPGSLRATLITLSGSFVGANLFFVYAGGGVGWLRERFARPWVAIALRIAAAWIAAVSVLMGALTFA